MESKGFIICIDDEQSVLNQLSAQLELKFGGTHEVEIAESAEEALELVDDLIDEGERIELLICDQIMPGLKGDRFLEQINGKYPDIKKILLTGQAGLESAIYAINNANLDKYIEKPWERENLALTVKTLLEQFRLQRQIKEFNKRLQEKNKTLESLHQIGFTLNTIQDKEVLARETVKALTVIARNKRVMYVPPTGIERREPIASPAIPKDLVAALHKSYKDSLESVLQSGLTQLINHGEPSELIPQSLIDQLEQLAYSLWIPSSTQEKFLGSLVLLYDEPPSSDEISTLSILSNQFASTLFNLELTGEKIKSERLATIGQMISSIIHDFKNPMTTIKGLVGLMGESDFSAEDRKTYSEMVIEEVDRVVGMVNELLEFSRGGRGEFRKSDVSFSDVMDKIVTVYEKEFADKSIALEKRINYQGEIQLDVEKIKRAFFNIIDNARDAMNNGGAITISAEKSDEDTVEITIADKGPGMPPEIREHIFEPFVTHGKIHGTGLGMAITKKIIDDHKGFIHVDSIEGQGTTFTIRLPLK